MCYADVRTKIFSTAASQSRNLQSAMSCFSSAFYYFANTNKCQNTLLVPHCPVGHPTQPSLCEQNREAHRGWKEGRREGGKKAACRSLSKSDRLLAFRRGGGKGGRKETFPSLPSPTPPGRSLQNFSPSPPFPRFFLPHLLFPNKGHQ